MDARQIINLGLGQLGAYYVTSLEPANTAIEKRMALHYEQWRDSELTRGRWVFATGFANLVGTVGPDATEQRPYAYLAPTDYLSIVRERSAKWQVKGKYIYSPVAIQTIEYKRRVPEDQFDPLFVDVLAARIAWENCEWVTQSNTKKADAERAYQTARRFAVVNNSLILDPEPSEINDEDDTWIQARAGWNL